MQESSPLISALRILAVMKLCGSVLPWKAKMTCEEEDRRGGYKPSRRRWEFPVPLRSSVRLVPPLPRAQPESVRPSRAEGLSWGSCGKVLCRGAGVTLCGSS